MQVLEDAEGNEEDVKVVLKEAAKDLYSSECHYI